MPAQPPGTPPKRWAEWRDYRTASNVRVVKKEFEKLSDVEYADMRAGMDEAATIGMSAAGTSGATSMRFGWIQRPG